MAQRLCLRCSSGRESPGRWPPRLSIRFPIVSGANAGALALLAAWAAPRPVAARAGDYYEGDLLGTAAIAAVLLAMPYARPEVSWLAGVTGGALGSCCWARPESGELACEVLRRFLSAVPPP